MKTKQSKTKPRMKAGRMASLVSGPMFGIWQPMDTAPKGGGADRTDDPKWVEPPKLLLGFADGSIDIGYWDWYYAPGGAGHAPGLSAWIVSDGAQVARYQGDPIVWMPIPRLPNNQGDTRSGQSADQAPSVE